jgi:hypothetical protein
VTSMDAVLRREGLDVVNLREHEVFEVLSLVPWARHSLAEYVRKHRPDLNSEVLASLEDLELAEG